MLDNVHLINFEYFGKSAWVTLVIFHNERKIYLKERKIVLSWDLKRNFLCNKEKCLCCKCLRFYFKDPLVHFLSQRRLSWLEILFILGSQINTNFSQCMAMLCILSMLLEYLQWTSLTLFKTTHATDVK